MSTMISIEEAARVLGVTTKTLRNWDKAGKLVPVRTLGGHRRYALDVIQRLVCNEKDTGNLCDQKPTE